MENRIKILIVDDEEIIRDLVHDTLILDEKFREEDLLLARNGQEGLDLFKLHHPRIVMTDIMMPRMKGDELIQHIRNLNQKVDIVVLTGYADLDTALNVISKGVIELLRKPFKAQELKHLIEKLINKISLESENDKFREKLIRAEKFSSIGLLAAGIAHEINNPNTFVKGNLDLLLKYWVIAQPFVAKGLQEETGPDKKKLELVLNTFEQTVKASIEGAERIRIISNALLSYSRGGDTKTEQSVKVLVEKSIAMLTNQTKLHELKLNFPVEPIKVLVNEQEIIQVIMNLVVNAEDALNDRYPQPQRGTLEISADPKPENGRIRLTIADNAGGMDEKTIHRIYDPFFTTKPQNKGTGLGLSISMNYVQKNGGSLEVSSKLGLGTTFTLFLPIASWS